MTASFSVPPGTPPMPALRAAAALPALVAGVGADYLGVWRRDLLAAPGVHDAATRRFWLQTADWHADLELPPDRPDFTGVDGFAACTDAQLHWLAGQRAFAGITRLAEGGRLCCWDRQIDFALGDAPDLGANALAGDTLHEWGALAEYYELWRREPGSAGGVSHAAEGAVHLLRAGSWFARVRDRALPASPALRARRARAEGHAGRAELIAFADLEVSIGRIGADGGATIAHSTLPWLEGLRIDLAPIG
ncbi:hypothetical protein [Derxia lacustris]|uniref:hypothetical protein n=1 Tax=Derxia lacustris TaxID=764842 RepID=UPI000A17736D|nr:hypothetical protein [Derxia lacustris]